VSGELRKNRELTRIGKEIKFRIVGNAIMILISIGNVGV